MHAGQDDDFTMLLNRATEGDGGAANWVWSRSYEELRAMATGIRQGGAPGRRRDSVDAPSPTTIIHESFFKTFRGGGASGVASGEASGASADASREPSWDSRAHFFGSVARAMGQFLIDWRRGSTRQKRGGGQRPASLGNLGGLEPAAASDDRARFELREWTPALVEALGRLQRRAPLVADVVWLRAMAGLSLEDTAIVLSIRPRTVSKRWNLGRALLRRELTRGGDGAAATAHGHGVLGGTRRAADRSS
ncbi:MAG: ECF-type sigma factor [Phycisphaerales bacterium]